MENPFAGGLDEVKVHLWHGVEDLYVPVQLSRTRGTSARGSHGSSTMSSRRPATSSRSPTACPTLSSGRFCSEMSDQYLGCADPGLVHFCSFISNKNTLGGRDLYDPCP
jgi:hypothetical protein